MSDVPDVWRIIADTYTTREYKTASGCAKAVSKFTKDKNVSEIHFNHYAAGENEFGGPWVWAATIVMG